MGAAYAKIVSKNARPRVALLSNGTEAGKGPKAVVDAHALLLEATDINFIGNVEGLDIPRGVADVIVCSGYVGNVVVKMLEGVAETVVGLARYAYKEKLLWRAALMMLSSGIQRLKEVTDWEQYGGAPLLGFENLFIKAHGRSGRARPVQRDPGRRQGASLGSVRRHRGRPGELPRPGPAAARRRRAESPDGRPRHPRLPLGPRQDLPPDRVRHPRRPGPLGDGDRAGQAGLPGRGGAAALAAPEPGAPHLHHQRQPGPDAPGAGRQAGARRRRVRRVRAEEQPAQPGPAALPRPARPGALQAASPAREPGRAARHAARDPVRRRRRGRRHHLLPVRRHPRPGWCR